MQISTTKWFVFNTHYYYFFIVTTGSNISFDNKLKLPELTADIRKGLACVDNSPVVFVIPDSGS